METIRNYLETMFANMPNTPEVLNAKKELLQMMEDKYNELIAEGKSENEAVGTVISEFGNIDDLTEELGLNMEDDHADSNEKSTDNGNNYTGYNKRHITYQEAGNYFRSRAVSGILIGIGVFLCIISVTMPMIGAAITFGADMGGYMESIFVSLMFVIIAIGVGFFIIAGVKDSRWKYIKKEPCYIDYTTAGYIKNEKERFHVMYAIMLTAGIVLCIISVVPPIMADNFRWYTGPVNIETMSAVAMFFIVATGVLLIVVASSLSGRYDKFLKMINAQGLSDAGDSDKSDVYYENKTLAVIMSLYWPTVTSIYLIWSFITFRWYISWIIWPIAAIINKVIESNLGSKKQGGYTDDYRSSTTAYRVVLTILTVGLIIFGVFGRFSFSFPFGLNIGGFLAGKTITNTISVNEYKDIVMDMSMGDVTIERGSSYSVKYSFPEKMLPEIESKDGVLTVKSKEDKVFPGNIFNKKYEMTIIIPDDAEINSLSAELDMGNIKYSGIDVEEAVDINADMGNIVISDSNAGSYTCDADMGNIEFQGINAKDMDLNADMGNIDISGTVSSLKADCSMGNVSFDPDTAITNEHIELKTDMGSIKVSGKDYGTRYNN